MITLALVSIGVGMLIMSLKPDEAIHFIIPQDSESKTKIKNLV